MKRRIVSLVFVVIVVVSVIVSCMQLPVPITIPMEATFSGPTQVGIAVTQEVTQAATVSPTVPVPTATESPFFIVGVMDAEVNAGDLVLAVANIAVNTGLSQKVLVQAPVSTCEKYLVQVRYIDFRLHLIGNELGGELGLNCVSEIHKVEASMGRPLMPVVILTELPLLVNRSIASRGLENTTAYDRWNNTRAWEIAIEAILSRR